jgi:hypothetical protein
MKVLILTHHEAIGVRLRMEIPTLQQQGHEVKVVAWNTSGQERRFDFPVTYVHHRRGGEFYETLKRGLLPTLGRICCLYPGTLKEVLNSSWDVVHCFHLALLPVAVLGKLLKGGRVVYDAFEFHGLNISRKLKNPMLARFSRIFLEKFERLLLAWVDGVLTFPSVGDQEMHKYAKYCRKVEVLMNVPHIKGIIERKTFPPPPTAVFTGLMDKAKGLYAMLEATSLVIAHCPDFKLVLIGTIHEDPAEVEQKIDSLGIRGNVIMHSWVPPEELGKFIDAAWVGLWLNQPTLIFSLCTTGTSQKGFTYWKYGLPVVATSFGEVAKSVAEEQAGILVDATKPAEIAQAVLTIIQNPALRQKMVENGLAAVRDKYNWEKEAVKLINLYQALE